MVAKNTLFEAVPYAVEHAIKKVGRDLRAARLRRKLTIEEVAEKIGAGARAVRAAENGKPSTGVAVYAALLWTYGLLPLFGDVADAQNDQQGLALSGADLPKRARKTKGLDNDF